MGLFDRLLKKRATVFDYALEHVKLTNMQKNTGDLFFAYISLAQMKSYESPKDSLNFKLPEQPLTDREFWKAYMRLHQQCFTGACMSCAISENRNMKIPHAFYEALKLSYEPLIKKMVDSKDSKDTKESKEFKMSAAIQVAGGSPFMWSILDYLHATGHTKEHLEFFMSIDDCVEGYRKYYSGIENTYLKFLNETLITDWEKFVKRYLPE
jgi:hypothetical protein